MNAEVIKDVKNAVYNEDGSVTCDVLSAGMDSYLPYTASRNDTTPFGQFLWQQLAAGTYGKITPFTVTQDMIEGAREQKHREINAWRDAQENAEYTFKFKEHTWDYGKASQARLQPVAALVKNGQLPDGFFWTDAHNHDVPMTAGKVLELESAMVGAMVVKGFEIHQRQRQMKQALDKLNTLEEIRTFRVA
ncbi:DUF4376 domain-containing protein [Salmonella enterica subsp. enterica serovar Bredeney]|nr:DUF4376 domain-containing protein [Salmonella enterica subsp. enterica serovar Bredeney]ECD3237309.1 DUF4376 domain-containing protein [Salmonella enterica subsp. enterica serovar Bredeney]EDO5624143.1 DUF4376 domain-containing protein [Salmonella enterica]